MKHKNIRLMLIFVTLFTLFTTSCSISITRNYYSEKPKTRIISDSSTYVLKLDSQIHKHTDGQK